MPERLVDKIYHLAPPGVILRANGMKPEPACEREHLNVEGSAQKATRLKAALASTPHSLMIDGTSRQALSGKFFEVEDPATGAAIAEVAAGDGEDIEEAVHAARHALRYGPWRSFPPTKRAALLFALADELEKEAGYYAALESLDAGHTVASILAGDLPLGLRALRDNAGWATRLGGETTMQSEGQQSANYYLREPVGVAGIITPWNAPFLMAIQKLSSALAAGCTVVIKPSELAPLSTIRIGQACQRVGLPAGVVNIVTGGASAGAALAAHPDVNLISFTGSTKVGRSIMAAAARSNLKRVVLELGGKSPVIVFADADLPKAAAAIVSEITFKSGQYCAAGSRVFIQAAVYDDFVDQMRVAMQAVRIGPGYASDSDMGPMISKRQRENAEEIVCHSLERGALAVCGGRPKPGPGYFFEPTILTQAPLGARVSQEEIFAPVLVVSSIPDDAALEDVARWANDSAYGLSAKVWTRDVRRVFEMTARLEAGQVVVNGGGGDAMLPFGGVKLSGYGRENGFAGVSAYTEIKAVRLGY